jgi:hypothetical protein
MGLGEPAERAHCIRGQEEDEDSAPRHSLTTQTSRSRDSANAVWPPFDTCYPIA